MTKEDIKYCLLLTASSVLAYFQLSFFIFSTKWDNLSAFFAYKYTASEWWISGKLPLWDPYQNLGYPMQGYVWYPITWLLNLPNGYSLYALNIETVLHIAIASIGMFFLAKHIRLKPSISFLAGLTYGLCGFVIASNHMIGFTIGAAWLPWTIFALLQVLNKPTIRYIAVFSIVCFFQLTGAYLAFSIVLFYIIIVLSIYHLIIHRKHKSPYIKSRVRALLVSFVIVVLLSSPYLFSIYDSLSYFSRAQALTYEARHYTGNFSWECFQSLLAPYINSSKMGFYGVDVSLSNIYIGIVPLVLLLFALLSSKIKYRMGYTFGLVLSLLLALGIQTPLHEWCCKIIPGFNLFRHPYLFTLYFTFIAVIVAYRFLNNLSENDWNGLKKGLVISIIGITFIFVSSIILSNNQELVQLYKEAINLPEKTSLSKYAHASFQLGLSLILLTALLVLSKNLSKFKKYLPLFVFLDLFFAIQLVGATNMYYRVPFEEIKGNLQKISHTNLTNQSYNTPLATLANSQIAAQAGFWVNLNSFQRTTGSDGYNPFVFSSFERFQQSSQFDSLLKQGVVHSDTAQVLVNNFKIAHNSFEMECDVSNNTPLYLNQNYHHNWKAFVDAEPIEVHKTEIGLMAIDIPKGFHTVQFVYESKILVVLFGLSTATFFLLIVLFTSSLRRFRISFKDTAL